MKADDAIGNKTYLKAIKTLQLLFAEKYCDGGWLPGSRELAKTLDISLSTCCKALAQLEAESFIHSYPGKGHYVIPNHQRCHKIGIILRDGANSPFVEECDSFIASLKYLRTRGFDINLIQGTHPAQLQDNAIAHGVDGLLWFKPSDAALPYLDEIATGCNIPLVAISWGDSRPPTQACSINYDDYSIGQAQATIMLRRKRRRLAFIGYPDNLQTIGALAALAAGGIDRRNDVFDHLVEQADDFRQRLEQKRYDGIIAWGDASTLETLFTLIAACPPKQRPTILLHDLEQPIINALAARNLRFMALSDKKAPGEVAAQLLTDHILHDRPLVNILLGANDMILQEYHKSGE